MVRNYKHKTDRRNESHRVKQLPVRFRRGFLTEIDNRTKLAQALRSNYETIVEQVSGGEPLTHLQSALVERFVWLEAFLQDIEQDLVDGAIDKAEAMGRWIQAVNALVGLAKTLGIHRRESNLWNTFDAGNGKATA